MRTHALDIAFDCFALAFASGVETNEPSRVIGSWRHEPPEPANHGRSEPPAMAYFILSSVP